MKKIIALLLTLITVVSLASCGASTGFSLLEDIFGILIATDDTEAYDTYAPVIFDTIPVDTEIVIPQTETLPHEVETLPIETEEIKIDENGTYDSAEDVALYIHTYGKLPKNYITKKEAEALGWVGGSLEPYAPGKCIGGTYFGNYEGILPEKKGRKYTECDIDTLGSSSRGVKRIVFSNDGLIYYTSDHYETFVLLYGAE